MSNFLYISIIRQRLLQAMQWSICIIACNSARTTFPFALISPVRIITECGAYLFGTKVSLLIWINYIKSYHLFGSMFKGAHVCVWVFSCPLSIVCLALICLLLLFDVWRIHLLHIFKNTNHFVHRMHCIFDVLSGFYCGWSFCLCFDQSLPVFVVCFLFFFPIFLLCCCFCCCCYFV